VLHICGPERRGWEAVNLGLHAKGDIITDMEKRIPHRGFL
jgi:hypothetical protein